MDERYFYEMAMYEKYNKTAHKAGRKPPLDAKMVSEQCNYNKKGLKNDR